MSIDRQELIPGTFALTNAELDEKLEEAVLQSARAENLVCCYLTEMRERGAYRDFGYSNMYDYAYERFGFKQRKTRYLLALGAKLTQLPQIREALATGAIGWTKATRIATVARVEDEAMWLDSALSISVSELDRRIKDGTDDFSGPVRLWFSHDARIVWENAIEICRRVSGAEISPTQAAEYLAAEFLATWAARAPVEEREEVEVEAEAEAGTASAAPETEPPQPPTADSDWVEVRSFVLERDRWKCTYPGCTSRCELDAHHIGFRSRGGGNDPGNVTALCRFHHALLHSGVIAVRGRAPFELIWTPPKLMQEVLERKRNRKNLYQGEFEIREWPSERPKELVPV